MSENKNSIVAWVAVVISILALLMVCAFASVKPVANDGTVGGQRAGLEEFIDGIKAGDVNAKWVSRRLEPGTNSVLLYRNTTGKDVFVDYGEVNVLTGETASTTYDVYVFATTSSSISTVNDFAAQTGTPGKQRLIGGITLATSTTATTTSSTYAAVAGKGNGAILVPDGSYLFGYMIQTFTTACTGSQCEQATSSNRGFNPVFNVNLHKSSAGNRGEAQSF